ncbi:MAG: AAA family ATPase, partial [Myxococcales bacterium]|nr:AAA family ATPase [Myxococcales bacterium]
ALEAETEAERIAAERQAALAALHEAKTEATRWVAEQRANLLGIREKLAKDRQDLLKIREGFVASREGALALDRRVRELAVARAKGLSNEDEADRLYEELVQVLSSFREELDESLGQIGEDGGDDYDIDGPAVTPTGIDTDTLDDLRRELRAEQNALREEREALRWERAEVLRDAVVGLNHSRLQLMGLLSRRHRRALQGLGPAGIGQAARELEQIRLEAQFHILSVPRFFEKRMTDAGSSAVPIVSFLIKLMVLVLVFRWVRSRSVQWIRKARIHWSAQRPDQWTTRRIVDLFWYLERVHVPLEWLLFLWALRETGGFKGIAEFDYAWIVALWILAGTLVVRFLHATAGRRIQVSTEQSELRYRSLRLVGMTVVAVGLFLDLAERTVGKGALYEWVLTLFWVLAIPLVLLLVSWWKTRIFERARQRKGQPFFAWVVRNSQGWMGFLAATAGGIYLAVQSTYHFIFRYASQIAFTRRTVAYLLRRQAEKSAASVHPMGALVPLSDDLREELCGPVAPAERAEVVPREELRGVVERLRDTKGTLTAIVGESGLGKSTFLEQVVETTDREALLLRSEEGTCDALLADLATSVDLEADAPIEDILATLVDRGIEVVAIDDAHRLVKPFIGGLAEADRLFELVRKSGDRISWVMTFAKSTWNYLSRARADRLLFDQVVALRPWTDGEIRTLVMNRCKKVGIDPSFEEFQMGHQAPEDPVEEEKRRRRDFFRILWDYTDGNPTHALHFWSLSLGTHPPSDQVYVQLFQTPSTLAVEKLAPTVFFVLRAILQLDRALESDIVRCTDLPPSDVAEALRVVCARDYVDQEKGRVSISTHWYRAVEDVLRRRHLIMA